MQNENLIPVEICHTRYNVEISFLQSLDQYGFIHLVSVEEKQYIETDELQILEKFIRMHYDLNINLEGIEAISFLLDRVQNMQDEIAYLKSKLKATTQHFLTTDDDM
ncbi:MAG: hypothetical protein JST21_17060 [Bacteroidetes bacterium]|nr:hypothetical protein [Bacteroidota bacterium]